MPTSRSSVCHFGHLVSSCRSPDGRPAEHEGGDPLSPACFGENGYTYEDTFYRGTAHFATDQITRELIAVGLVTDSEGTQPEFKRVNPTYFGGPRARLKLVDISDLEMATLNITNTLAGTFRWYLHLTPT